jgi:uncharacterized lipoprotein YddW (UPF0748 family)
MILLLALLSLAAPAAASPSPEVRGLWVVRTALVSPQSVDHAVDDAARAGFNTLFVQVRGRGDAFYASRVSPRAAQLSGQPRSFDPLARLLERARTRGLAVHAWVNVLLTAGFGQPLPPDHPVARHPEWLMVPKSAAARALHAPRVSLRAIVESASSDAVEGFYLSPSAPGVGDHLAAMVDELVRNYPVDGLHLDFIRYPAPDFDYSRAALTRFAARGPHGALLQGPERDPAGWLRYRQDTVTNLTARLARTARAARPGLVVSAAVVPEEALAKEHRFQDWPAWLAMGLVDAVCPMAYTPEADIFRQQVLDARARVGRDASVWVGVGAYRLTTGETIERIRTARASGASGVVVFSHESLQAADLDRLRLEAFATTTAAAPSTPGATGR